MNTTPTGRPKMQHSPSMRMWIEMMLEMDSPSYQAKSEEERRRFHIQLRGRASWAFKFVCSEMDARVILIAKRMGLLTKGEWDRLWEGRTSRTVKFMKAVDQAWEKVFGYKVPRPLRGHATDSILQWLRAKVDNPTLPIPSIQFFEAGELAPQVEEEVVSEHNGHEYGSRFQKLADTLALILYIKATPDAQAEMREIWEEEGWNHLLETVGYKMAEPEPINPEQIAHADQDAIDTAFYDLLRGIEFR